MSNLDLISLCYAFADKKLNILADDAEQKRLQDTLLANFQDRRLKIEDKSMEMDVEAREHAL